jgi:hypothetical protein
MTNASPDDLYRKALEAEDGEPISAGARVAHVQLSVESGRTCYVDLSGVPADERAALVTRIKKMVTEAIAAASPHHRATQSPANKPK